MNHGNGSHHSDVFQQLLVLPKNHKESLNLISEFLQRNVIQCETFEKGCFGIEQIIPVLLGSNLDNDLKKGILNSIMKVPKKWHPRVFAEISHNLNKSLFVNPSNEPYIDTVRCYFQNIVVLLSNSSVSQHILIADFLHIASTYESVLCKLSMINSKQEATKVEEIEIAELYHFLIQTLIVFVDESCKYKSSLDFPYSLYELIGSLMSNNKLNINTINNCGLLVVTLNYKFFDLSSSLLILKRFSEKSPIQCLAICHGYLASTSLELYISSSPDNLLALICDTVWLIYSEHANDSLIVIGVLKIILLLTKNSNLESHNVPKNCIRSLIGLLLSHLDHCLSSVKNLSKEALNHLIQQKNEVVVFELLTFIESTHRIDRKTCVILMAFSGTIEFSRILTSYETIIADLQNAAKNVISSSYVCQTYLSLMISDYSDETVQIWFDVWIKPLLVECSNYNLLLEHILVPVVKISNAVFEKLIKHCRYVNDDNYSVIVKFLLETKTCNSSGIVDFSNFSQLNLNSNYWQNLLPFEMMMYAICVPSSMDALTTANLIIENLNRNNDIIAPEEIDLLKFFIDSQFAIDKSEFRCKFLNLLNQLFTKISQYFNSNHRNFKEEHISDFIDWIIRYSLSNMFPGASYERRYTALRICKIIIDTNLWLPSLMNTFSTKIFFNSLRDGFEENEKIAKYILKQFFLQKPDLVHDADKVALYHEAIEMIGGMRFSEHNTAAYLLEILCCIVSSMEYFSNIALEHEMKHITEGFRNLKISEEGCYIIHLQILVSKLKVQLNLCKNEKITKYPLHGFLHVIRHLLIHAPLKNLSAVDITSWGILINDIIQISMSCNEFAVFIVSHSSPEGYLPDADEVNEEGEHVFNAAQQTLLCNWRAVKGASLLLGDLVEKFSVGYIRNSKTYLYKETFLKIGEHLKKLIYKITHKGSFKQVNIALFQYCNRCWRLPDSDINAVPKRWLKEIENLIVAHAKQLCLTRRSAGIPCIVLAIFCTEFDDKRKFTSNLLNEFMENMFEILNNKNAEIESKIHALNIIRDLFVHKDMAEPIHSYIEKAVIVAINGFKSSNWNERNTSNLLLSAILTRIFGVSRSRTDISWKNKMTGKIFFQKYPRLFDIFLSHLQQNKREDVNVQSAVYPILLILARLYSSYHDEWNDTFQLTTFVPYIYNCSENSIFKIRQLTVQAIVPFITRDIYVEHCNKIWSDVMLPLPENTKHGLLLQLDGLLYNIPELNEKQNDDLTLLSIRIFLEANSILLGDHSFVIKEKLLIILSSLSKRYYHIIDFSKMKNYPLGERTFKSDKFHLNEQNFIAASSIFNVGLKYLTTLKNNDTFTFINLLESMIQQEVSKQNSNTVVDFVLGIVSLKTINKENTILQNLISNRSNDDYKKCLLKSKVIYLFISNQLSDNEPYRVFELLYVLSEFLKQSQDRNPIKVLASFCKKYSNNTKLVVPVLSCMDILLEKHNCWGEDCFFIMKSLLALYHKLCWEDQRKLRRFFFKYSCCGFLNDDIHLALDVWAFVIGQIPSIDENDFLFFKRIASDSFNASNYEDHFIVDKCIRIFCCNFQSTPLFCSVGLVSWIIKYLGVILNNVEKNEVFFGDLPDYLEDHLLICQLSFKYLNILLEQSPSIMRDHLSTATLSWILKQGGFKEECFTDSTIRDLISTIVRKFDNVISYGSSESSRVSFLTGETVEEQIIAIKLSLLSTLLNHNSELNTILV